ncbi:carbon monoxide dehydrogenase [Alphaproteobacteria bacterium 46_93_T64]|nr:carbon monoxide dehydrogenase [Alphaproteobacteria bacterium 46_93_T64]
MEMSGEELINAPREQVWAALNDPEILRQAISGCQSVEKEDDTSFSAVVKVKVGPVKATFKGKVTLSNIDAPNGYTITGEGKGGAAGFGKGGADISLSDAEGGTLLKYKVKASVGGKMAQIGSRLIDSTAKKLAGEFFSNFNDLVSNSAAETEPNETAETAIEEVPATTVQTAPEKEGSNWTKPSFVIPAALAIVIVLYLLS